jgi:hypothetical protein
MERVASTARNRATTQPLGGRKGRNTRGRGGGGIFRGILSRERGDRGQEEGVGIAEEGKAKKWRGGGGGAIAQGSLF